MPGRKPKPTAYHKLTGGRKKTHRPLPENEPEPERLIKLPKPPPTLNSIGKKEWKRAGKEFLSVGVLNRMNLPAFEGLCISYQLLSESTIELGKTGFLIKAPSGYPIPSPYLSIQRNAMSHLNKWLVEFGATPSSATKVKVEKKKDTDPLADFLTKGKKLHKVKG